METKALRGIPWTFLGLGVSKALALLTTLVLARLVAPSDFGLMALGLIAVNFLYWFGGISFGQTLVVHQELDDRGRGTVLTLALAGAAVASAALVVLAPVAADLLNQPRLDEVLVGLAPAVLITGVGSFYESLLQSRLEFRRRFVALMVQTATFSVVAITLAAAGAGVWSLVVGQLASVTLFAIALVVLSTIRVRPAWDRTVAGEVFRSGQGFLLQGVTVFIRQNMDTVIVGRAFRSASVGFYAMAFRLGDLTYSALADPIARVTFPAFARSKARQEDVRPAFLIVVRIVALVTVPLGALLSATADPFTAAIFGPEWAPMAGPLAVVGIWAAVRPVEATIGWLLNSLGRAGVVGWVAVFVLVPLAVGLVLAVSTDDLALVACVPLADTLLSLGILTVLAGRHAGLAPSRLWRSLSPIIVAGAGSWVAARLVSEVASGLPAGAALLLAVAAGAAVYLVALAALDRSVITTAVAQLGRVLGRRRSPSPAA